MNPPPPVLRVFLVENHEDTLQFMTMYLETLGHQVTSARTMADALSRIPSLPIDLLISDIGLPDGDGWQLLEKLALPKPLFAVAMSGYGLKADRAKSLAAGFRHHLIKPFMPDELDPILVEACALL